MFYKKNISLQLSEELFKNPTSEYRGAPFWAWNCKLNKELLVRQIGYLKEMGFGGFHMHSRSGMATEYLSDEFMELVDTCVKEAEKNNMLAWLYDEDRWPSGAAGGIVTKNHKFRQRRLLFTVKKKDDVIDYSEASENGGTALLACYDVVLDKDGNLEKYSRIRPDEKEIGTKWYAYMTTNAGEGWFNGQAYIDTLNPEAVQEFIKVTYERYKEVEGDKFGSIIPAIFTDEPQFACKETFKYPTDKKDVNMPWTPQFEKGYTETYNEDILDYVPELFLNLKDNTVSVHRYRYHDYVSELFAQNYAGQCGKWCDENNLRLTGHLMYEYPLWGQTAYIGDAMRSYSHFQIPGIDMLNGSIELITAKQTQSSCHQFGREAMASELYGVTNWSFDFRGHKIHGDWQAALGVTVRVPHLSWVSMEGMAKRDYPATINYQSPWYKEYGYVEDHFARVNTAMTRGKAVVRVGVIHPIESYWLHWGPEFSEAGVRARIEEQFSSLANWLICGCIDFDYICESTLSSQYIETNKQFKVGCMEYDVVVVPACETLRNTTLKALNKFKANGGKLIFMGNAPKYTDALPSDKGLELWKISEKTDFDKNALLEALEEFRAIDIRDEYGHRTDNLIYQLRRDNDCSWLFIAHNAEPYNKDICGDIPQKIRLKVIGEYTPVLWDTLNGTKMPIPYSIENGNTVIHKKVYAHDSLLIQLNSRFEEYATVSENNKRKIYEKNLLGLFDYKRCEPNVVLLDRAKYSIDGKDFSAAEDILRISNICLEEIYGDTFDASHSDISKAQPWAVPEEEVRHHVTLELEVHSRIDKDNIMLGAELAEKLEIEWNGETVENNINGYYVDESVKTLPLPPLRKGRNVLKVTVPFTRRTNLEAYYILGDFDVYVKGTESIIVPMADKIGFSDISCQGLAFYGGNIIYKAEVETPEGDMEIHVPYYRGSLVRVIVDGTDRGVIAYAPYSLMIENMSGGKHVIEFKLFGNRFNTFAPLHDTERRRYVGPPAWLTTGDRWTYGYMFKQMGILSGPVISVYKRS